MRKNVKATRIGLPFVHALLPTIPADHAWGQLKPHGKVVGTITCTEAGGRFLSAFELLGTPSQDFMFPVLAQTDVYHTGIAILNTNPEPATVSLEICGVDRTMSASTSVTLGAKSQEAEYLNHYFPNLDHVLKGNIRIHSTESLSGMALIHGRVFTFMTAIPSRCLVPIVG
jgi:hypothetical protein